MKNFKGLKLFLSLARPFIYCSLIRSYFNNDSTLKQLFQNLSVQFTRRPTSMRKSVYSPWSNPKLEGQFIINISIP